MLFQNAGFAIGYLYIQIFWYYINRGSFLLLLDAGLVFWDAVDGFRDAIAQFNCRISGGSFSRVYQKAISMN